MFECLVNKESRKANIDGAQTWEDLDKRSESRKEGGRWRLSSEKPPRQRGGARTATASFFKFPL